MARLSSTSCRASARAAEAAVSMSGAVSPVVKSLVRASMALRASAYTASTPSRSGALNSFSFQPS